MLEVPKTDTVFTGDLSEINFGFLNTILDKCKEAILHAPEIDLPRSLADFVRIFTQEEYVDFAIWTDSLCISGIPIRNGAFINLGIENGKVELLFFFDLRDVNSDCVAGINTLKSWTGQFRQDYGFKAVVCKIDNGEENEYYFDEKGFGPMYKELFV